MQHSPEEQGRFLIGYYQERWGRSGDAVKDADIDDDFDASDKE
jgi:hypothetical protein